MPIVSNRSLLSTLIAIALLALVAVSLYATRIYATMNDTVDLDQAENITLSKGSSIRTLAQQLIDMGLLEDEYHLLIWGRLTGQATRLQAGEYRIMPDTSLASLIDDMASGNVITHSITLIEGLTFRQALESIQANPVVTTTLSGLSDEQIMQKIGHPDEHPEGRFFADTYHISNGVTDSELLNRAYDALQQILQQEWQQRAPGLPFKTPYEALILASIVEKESAIAEERPLIAGLFINRLLKKMRLQTDPTVIYGIEDYDGDIRYRDLRKDTPYNTYTRSGLPPTPIALVGREALHATLHPDTTDYLYFVAFGDGSGRHVFSTNLADHEKAVDKYQRKRKPLR